MAGFHLQELSVWGLPRLRRVGHQGHERLTWHRRTQTHRHQLSELGFHFLVHVYDLHIAASQAAPETACKQSKERTGRGSTLKSFLWMTSFSQCVYREATSQIQFHSNLAVHYCEPGKRAQTAWKRLLTLPCNTWRWSGTRSAPVCWRIQGPSRITPS